VIWKSFYARKSRLSSAKASSKLSGEIPRVRAENRRVLHRLSKTWKSNRENFAPPTASNGSTTKSNLEVAPLPAVRLSTLEELPRLRIMRPMNHFSAFVAAVLLLNPRICLRAEISSAELSGAARVAGLEFSEAESRQMLKRLDNHLRSLTELRQNPPANSLAPALIFDPRPFGFIMPREANSARWNPPPEIELPPERDELAFFSVGQLASLLRSGKISSEELTRFHLERLRQYAPALHCVVTLTEDRALASARRADAELRAGQWRGPLHGVPYGVKDLLDVAGTPSTWGVSLYTNQIAEADAAVVRKLDAAGAVLVAKFSLGELAMGDVWHGGLTRNPWHPGKGSSGSSAGSASAVAAGLVPFALGSETLGSIVSPSTVCGVTGLRPTFGRVSRAGAMTLCYSLDKLGPLARSAEDCALVLEVIRGPDGNDRSVIEAPFNIPNRDRFKHLRVGYLETDFARNYANKTNDQAALEVLRSLGAQLQPVSLPKHPKGAFYFLLSAEAAASFDELTRSNQDDQLVQQGDGSWPNSFRSARFISAVDYLQANRARAQLMDDMHAIFQQVDVLVAPTWNGNQLLYSNMTGHPCVVVPNGDLRATERPSICFLAGLFREEDALAAAAAFQHATPWHQQQPGLSALTQTPSH
jgi:Asp-tRNA(Asn)/Glu-tRNA(Gln) amidotransferase A subunit family amidase